MDIDHGETQVTLTGDRRDEARTEELNNLKLALATFALQLDAFELRTRGGMIPPPDVARSPQKELTRWPSIRSYGSKRDT